MKDGKKTMNLASIIKMVMGLIWIKEPILGPLVLLSGLFLYIITGDKKENSIKYKNWIILLAIISIPDVIGSIMTFVGLSNNLKEYQQSNPKKAPPKIVYVVDKETKKIDILLKLGVGMVFIASLLFATTSWSFVSNIIKVIALILFGILFLILSNVTETRFKLYRSSFIYWLLSMSLLTLSIVAILYFQLFGKYLSFQGLGFNLAYMITFLTGSAFILITYLKYPKKYLLFISYTGIIISMIFLFNHVSLSLMMILCALSIITLLTNILINKKTSLYEYSKILTYILCILCLATKGNALETSITCLINIININYLYILNEKKQESFIYIALTYLLLVCGLFSFQKAGEIVLLIVVLVSSLYTVLIHAKFIPMEDNNIKANYILYSIVVAYSFMNTINPSFNKICIYQLLIASIYFLINRMVKQGLWNTTKLEITKYIEPISVFTIIFSIVNLLINQNVAFYSYISSSIIYCILHFISKDKIEKNTNEWAIIITSFLALMVNNNLLIPFLITIITSLYVFSITIEKEESKRKKIITYLLLLSSLYIPFINFNTLKIELIIPVIIFIIIIFLVAYFLKDELITKISYMYITIPIISLIEEYKLKNDIREILYSLLCLYLIFIINKFFIKKPLIKNIVGIIGIILFTVGVFFIDSIIVGIYIGVLGIIIIALGYKKEELFPIFITGIILTILNILYRLKEVWKIIPFWLYLLFGGLTLIGFVMYKEIKKETNDKK